MAIKIRIPYNTTSGVIPTSLDIGEMAINTADGILYTKNAAGNIVAIGSQGPQGNQGINGVTGFQGFQGGQGPQGNQGNQGVQGAARGFQGFQGVDGTQGPQGFQGSVTGPQGNQGFQGLQGPQGGVQGAQGLQGSVGPQGSQGLQGAAQGAQGSQGSLGFQGAQGSQGSQSTVQGSQGNIGPQGFTGPSPTGATGFQGRLGSQGTTGATGPTGPTGAPGPAAPTGARGPQGFQGPQGIAYYTPGPTGVNTCFPAGSMVLMADKNWKPIELVDVGDEMYSPNGGKTVCRERYVTRLGPRKMYRMIDNSISWSSEHTFWVKRKDAEYLWTMDKAQLKHEEDIGVIKGIKNWDKILEGADNMSEHFGHIDGFKYNTPVEIKEYYGNENLPLFLPLSDKGELIIVNGYIVGAAVNEYECDYSQFKWNGKEI